ncbi:MAG: patatin-like phospholipase family protein [Nitrospinota bacterium]
MQNKHKADAVFEGGGVKGIALLGALSEMEKYWTWENVAGTSAGAIVASFTAVGMSATEIRGILDKINLTELTDEAWEDKLDRLVTMLNPASRFPILKRLPLIGRFFATASSILDHPISIIKDFGIFEGNRFVDLVNENLPKHIRTFGVADILYEKEAPKTGPGSRYRYKLRVIASDITANRMIILPQDIHYYGYDPDDLEIATALRMSMSIPVFFEPYRLKNRNTGQEHLIVDGGILSNYPVWLFDAPVGTDPQWPTFGFDLYRPADEADGEAPWPQHLNDINNIFDFAKAIWNTMFSAVDRRYIAKRHWARTIPIDNLGFTATDFNLSNEDKGNLWDSGVEAAEQFMKNWGDPKRGFEAWKNQYRGEVEDAQRRAQQLAPQP